MCMEVNLMRINDKVNERLDQSFNKTNETFQSILVRLAKIDEAQKKIDIRRNAEATGKKMTQDQVDCEVVVDEEIVAVKTELLDAEEYLAQLKVAVAAMVHKRDSIENEVRMVMSKVSMTNGDVSSETRYDAQVEAVDRATQASMLGR